MKKSELETYMLDTFGKQKGDMLYALSLVRLNELVKKSEKLHGGSANQMKTLENTILPRVALYQILKENNDTKEKALDIMEGYMLGVRGARMHKSMLKFERIPFFFSIFSSVFIKCNTGSDNWESYVALREKKKFCYNITRCLWKDACDENGCPELCQFFCKTDNVHFGNLDRLGFERTQTLGMGGKMCDFVFYDKR